MEKYDSSPVFRLGYAIGSLLKSLNSPLSEDSSFAAARLRTRLRMFINQNKDDSQLRHSLNSAQDVISCIDDFIEDEQKTNKLTKGIPPGGITALPYKSILISAISDFQTFLEADLPQLNIFSVAQHRGYKMDILINNGESLLSKNTLTLLGVSRVDVIREIRESARCLAFDVPTSAGLHLCRAVEIIITKEYFPVLELVVPKIKSLGIFITRMEKNGKADPRVISKLKDFRDHYRNRITHPEEFWDIDNADSAFGTAINVIDSIVKDIQEIKANGP